MDPFGEAEKNRFAPSILICDSIRNPEQPRRGSLWSEGLGFQGLDLGALGVWV